MKRLLRLLSLLVCTLTMGWADTYFLLVDPLNDQVICQVGDAAGFAERIPPACTFNIPLSLMGFDSGILVDANTPEWTYIENGEERAACRSSLTPRSWIAISCVWYSQRITQALGLAKFTDYVNAFDYGNCDLSGDRGLNNGLTRAWFSSLTITMEEQLIFLAKMLNHELPITASTLEQARELFWLEELANGWQLYGKTGAGCATTPEQKRCFGWLVGWVEKDDRQLLFALNMRNLPSVPDPLARRRLVIQLLEQAQLSF